MNIKIDKELPTCTIEYQSNYDLSLGLPGKIIVKDSISGAATNPISFLLKSSKTYEIYDKAGNRNTCEVKVKVTLQHRYKTCDGYKSCANADYCGRNTYSCNCSDCKYGSNTCRGGCNRSKCSRYYCCSNLAGTRCKSLSRPGNYKYCSCTDYKCTDWDSCKYGSNTCSYGCDTCQGDAKSCANPTCGCASYSYSEWTLGACTNVPGKTCETRGGYLRGD